MMLVNYLWYIPSRLGAHDEETALIYHAQISNALKQAMAATANFENDLLDAADMGVLAAGMAIDAVVFGQEQGEIQEHFNVFVNSKIPEVEDEPN